MIFLPSKFLWSIKNVKEFFSILLRGFSFWAKHKIFISTSGLGVLGVKNERIYQSFTHENILAP